MHPLPIWFWVRHRHYRLVSWRQGQPSALHQPIEPNRALALADLWMRQASGSDPWVRAHLIKLHVELALSSGPYRGVGTAFLATWLRQQIIQGRVLVYEVLPEMAEGQSHEEYGRLIGVPLTASASEPVPEPPTPERPFHRFPIADQSGGLPDEFSVECPDPSYRSESTQTAHRDVIDWLRKYDRATTWNDTLGAEHGGGFLSSTTVARVMEPGTIVYRYYGGKANPLGTWWFIHCYGGDPKQFAALPPGCTAAYMVKARVKKPTEVLVGLGAPRCTNKPGGPVQYRFPYQATMLDSVKIENDYLELI